MGEDNTKPEVTGEIRNKQGQFVEGVSGNPEGRPKGSLSVTAEIKKRLEEVPEGQKRTHLKMLVERILKQAIQDGDNNMIKSIWAYVDGMPLQKTESKIEGDLIVRQVTYQEQKKEKEKEKKSE